MAGAWLKRARRYAARSSTRHSKQTKQKQNRAERNETPRGKRATPLNRLANRPFFIPRCVRSFSRSKPPGCTSFSSHFVLPCIVRSAACTACNIRFCEIAVIFSENPLTKCPCYWLYSEGLFSCPKVFPKIGLSNGNSRGLLVRAFFCPESFFRKTPRQNAFFVAYLWRGFVVEKIFSDFLRKTLNFCPSKTPLLWGSFAWEESFSEKWSVKTPFPWQPYEGILWNTHKTF